MARLLQALIALSFACVLLLLTSPTYASAQNWVNHGGDIYNRRHAKLETKISNETVSKMQLQWKFYAGDDITATPAIYNGIVYFPTWDGNLFALNALDGSLVWKINLPNLTGLKPPETRPDISKPYVLSRTTPTVTASKLFISLYGPAYILAIGRLTGQLLWKTRLEKHNFSLVTMSATHFRGRLYVGTSSLEEAASEELCCTFRGSFLKLNARSGRILWKKYMLPNNFGKRGSYAGAAIWGSSPSIDIIRNHVYVATGNVYTVPPSVEACQAEQNNQTTPLKNESCLGSNIHGNSIVALDRTSGKIRWAQRLGGYDVWRFACLQPGACPIGPGVDADFGEAPMAITVKVNGTRRDIVVAGQRSGFVWALRRSSGKLVWSTEAGPGGFFGGAIWGSATDGRRVYTNIGNSNRVNFTLRPSAETTTAGGWVGMDSGSGRVVWTTANPRNSTALGPVTIANGILFAGSPDPMGTFYAMNAVTGEVMWSYDTGSSIVGGASVSHGCAYVGTGKGLLRPPYTSGTTLYAFCVPK